MQDAWLLFSSFKFCCGNEALVGLQWQASDTFTGCVRESKVTFKLQLDHKTKVQSLWCFGNERSQAFILNAILCKKLVEPISSMQWPKWLKDPKNGRAHLAQKTLLNVIFQLNRSIACFLVPKRYNFIDLRLVCWRKIWFLLLNKTGLQWPLRLQVSPNNKQGVPLKGL